MQYSLASLALVALAAAKPMPQGVTSAISSSASPPSGCQTSYSGSFSIQTVNVTTSSKVKRQADDTLVMTLSNGILKDDKGRTGYIAANSQFQFDAPPQTGAIYTAGWSVCSNGSLTIGDDSVFYQCLSGTFYNLYEDNPLNAGQCSPVYINVIGGSSSSVAASQTSDGQVTRSAAPASQLSDGQVTASAVSSRVSQISDGQPQAASAVTQISDGQPQAASATAAPISQISDGQIQATSANAAPISQISDGQIQATSANAAPISQISDGQIQATSAAVTQVTQISDGQVQATTAAPVSQISDGQIQASGGAKSTSASPSASVVPYTGGAIPVAIRGELFGLAAGVLAVAML